MQTKDSKESVENYLEIILILKKRQEVVRSIDIVNAMNFKKPSISIAMKKLRESGLIVMDECGYISLTEEGEAVAKSVYERHVVLTKALMFLGVPEGIAGEDACRMEHVLHAESFEKIKEYIEGLPEKCILEIQSK